ncbi:T9SS type A sorting domain-containing protein [Chryseobacterium sp. SIMBA_028]|uniref:T9SS type A sorting domain-containing protein n=2 Tax=Bacteria TaxID=2 RepID=UPI00397BEC0A
MKKKIITGILLYACNLINAQVTLTKDLSYGNNGEYVYNDAGGYSAHTFIGDKLLVAHTYLNISGNNKYIKYTRLNSNGTHDLSFGINGSFVDSGSLGSASSLLDANTDYLINYSDDKYFITGQYDSAFQMNWAENGITGKKYINILPNGNLLFRKDDHFTRILANGTLDPSYGTNGKLSTLSYSTAFIYGIVSNDFAYEFGSGDYSNVNNYGIRKLNILTGSLDSGYGNSGLGETSIVPTTIRNSIYNEADGSMLNMLNGNSSNNNQYSISKTMSSGFLDAGFGTNGVFTLNNEINSINYTPYSNFYEDNASRIFFLLKSDVGDIAITSYSSSGVLRNINDQPVFNTGDNIYTNYNYGDYPNFQVVENYLYFFSPKKITRYIISEQTLSVAEDLTKNKKISFVNPFKNELILNTKEKIKNIEVYSESGHLVLVSKELRLNTASLLKGIYFIKITTASNQIISEKAIKN